MKRTATVLVVSMSMLISMSMLVGCGGGAERPPENGGTSVAEPEPPAPPRISACDVLRAMPHETQVVVHASFEAIKRAPLFEVIGASLDEWHAGVELLSQGGDRRMLDLWTIGERLDWVVYGALRAPPGRAPESLLVVKGRFEDAHFRTILAMWHQNPGPVTAQDSSGGGGGSHIEQLDHGEAPLTRGTHEGRALLELGDHAVGELELGAWVTGRTDQVKRAMRRYHEDRALPCGITVDIPAELIADSGFFEREIGWLSHEPTVLVSQIDQGRAAAAAERFQHARAFAGHIAIGADMQFRVMIEADTAPHAAQIAEGLRQDLSAADAPDRPSMLGLGQLMRAMQTRAEGTRVVMSTTLDAPHAYLLWGRVSGVVGAGFFVLQSLRDFFQGLAGLGGALPPGAFGPQT